MTRRAPGCDWASLYATDAFAGGSGEVAAGVIADPGQRVQIQVDVAAFAPDEPGRPRRLLSLGEANWDKIMTPRHLDRLRRAAALLAVKGYDVTGTKLACYGGAGFDDALHDAARADPDVLLVGLQDLYR